MSLAVRGGYVPLRTATAKGPASPKWLVYYYVVQISCQLALLSDYLAGARFMFRASTFGMSLLALAVTTGRRGIKPHPATPLALGVLLIVAFGALNPGTGSQLGALATMAMYAAILGPIFWVQRLDINIGFFRKIVLLVWGFQSLSALVGALQVYYPGVFQPAISTMLADNYVSSLTITLSSGAQILRPSGLTDSPGGAAAAGTYSILLGLGLWTTKPSSLLRILLAASLVIGLFVLYLCQIRSLVVMVAISGMAMAFVHAARGRIRSFAAVSLALGGFAFIAFAAAVSVGGEDVVRRLSTLVDSSPSEVYYTNRGIFLEHTLTELLPQYPLGAGLARYGMMANYFGGGPGNDIYVEIQWTAWLLDGGVLLLVVYGLLLAVTLFTIWRLGRTAKGDGQLGNWAAMLVGYDIGTIALTFNFPVFISSLGLDFWLLNAALFVVAVREEELRPDRVSVTREPAAG